MATLTLITGGQRSGKSNFAQKQALSQAANPVYLATAKVWDKEFEKRIERHKADRNHRWTTIEEPLYLDKTDINNRIVVVDCITLWLTNVLMHCNEEVDQALEFAKNQWLEMLKRESQIFVVSNEIGMGLHADTALGRKFTDLQGWTNQFLAQKAQNVFFMVSGIPLKIK